MGMTPDSTDPRDEPLEADLPGFGPSVRNRLDPPLPSTVTSSSTKPAAEKDWDELSAEELDDLGAEVHDEPPEDPEWFAHAGPKNPPRSSRGSTEPDPAVAGAFGQLAQLVVTFASLGIDRTVGHGSRAWITTEDEAAAIAEPIGRIAARHAPIGEGAEGDVADGIEAGMAVAGYGMRASVDHARGNTVEAPAQPGGEQ